MVLADVFIFRYEQRCDVIDRPAHFPSEWFVPGIYLPAAHAYTESYKPDVPIKLHIVKEEQQLEFTDPMLVQIQGEQTLIRAFAPRISGISQGAREAYILIVPRKKK